MPARKRVCGYQPRLYGAGAGAPARPARRPDSGEPIGRNTAPCIAYASYRIAQRDPKATIIVTPADHAVLREDEFRRLISDCCGGRAANDVLITLGIQPSRPDTGYGYIQYMDEQSLPGGQLHKVKTFTEKPNLELAKMFVESGEFLWNSGLFVWRADVIVAGIPSLPERLAEVFEEGATRLGTAQEEDFISEAYSRCRNISIDYGMMEKADNVYVLPADFGWSDLGTWDSLHRIGPHDEKGNMVNGDVMLYDTTDCVIKTPAERLMVVQGLEDYIVAEYDNVLLICKPRGAAREGIRGRCEGQEGQRV